MKTNEEFYWDDYSPFFYAGDAIIPANVIDLNLEGGTGWAADIALGESPVMIEFFAEKASDEEAGKESKPWLNLVSPHLEERYGHHLWIRVEDDCIVVGDWPGETRNQRMLNLIFNAWRLENLDVEGFLKWLYRLQRMPIVIDPATKYFKPGA